MANDSLSAAKAAKNDEFYTQYYDIEREINAYLEYDPDVFRDKTVLLPCDDPEWSNFTLYFAQHFQTLGLKKLISTSYAPESKKYKAPYMPSLFEQDAPQFDPDKTSIKGKIFVLDHDMDGDGKIDFHDLEWRYLDGDGDFRSEEVTRLRDESDILGLTKVTKIRRFKDLYTPFLRNFPYFSPIFYHFPTFPTFYIKYSGAAGWGLRRYWWG